MLSLCLQVELAQTMQHFQQHLQQTALIAQQLLAQQVAGQAARDPGSSDSRPSSAAARATHRLSHAHSSSGGGAGSRPGSRGHQGRNRLQTAGTQAAGTQACGSLLLLAATPATAADAGVGVGLWPAAGLMQLEGVLEADEPPSAEEVQAYARYLGIDPLQVRYGVPGECWQEVQLRL